MSVKNKPLPVFIVLRELITDPNNIEHQPNSFMKIVSDKTNSNLGIEDSGISMTKNELV